MSLHMTVWYLELFSKYLQYRKTVLIAAILMHDFSTTKCIITSTSQATKIVKRNFKYFNEIFDQAGVC